ncbi:MAG: TrbC/VirB2 family protein [Novosphingobium sp.]|uniref:TrbC/VirB2 family protein n=1 Tax=Novosphingobium sp. TaxID=1874826 RepID=UPI0032BE0DB3
MQAILFFSASATARPGLGGLDWIAALITGPVGTALAVIAVAWFGFAVLGGRLPLRRGGVLVMGCFILFAAPALANSLMALARNSSSGGLPVEPKRMDISPPPAPATPPVYDPYAGASLPN